MYKLRATPSFASSYLQWKLNNGLDGLLNGLLNGLLKEFPDILSMSDPTID